VTAAPVSRSGLIDEDALDEMLDETVALVSIMSANNETGVIAPIARLAEAAHEVGALFHADATQTVGKVPVDLESLGVDLASFSAHKLYGPKGVGALYVRRGVDLDPLLHGGGHERGLRSGTLNVPGIVGFGRATELASIVMSEESTRQSDLTRRLVEGLGKLPNVTLIASESERLPNTANLRFGGVDGEAVMANAPNLLVSSGSACTSMAPEPSHVLCAMGLSAEEAQECLRFSLGRPTTPSDIDQAIEMIVHSVERVRSFDMVPAR
jgi:cysteine desulfurase